MTSALTSMASAFPAVWERTASGPAANPHQWVVEVVTQETDGITRMLWRLLGNEADVLDAFQDTFCKLAQRGDRGDLRSARAYAYRTATNIGIELLRSRKRRGRHWDAIVAERAQAARTNDAEPPAPMPVCDEGLRDAISLLPAHLRSVIVLRDLARLPYDEVGRTLGISSATARVYRRHAIVRLSGLLGEVTDP